MLPNFICFTLAAMAQDPPFIPPTAAEVVEMPEVPVEVPAEVPVTSPEVIAMKGTSEIAPPESTIETPEDVVVATKSIADDLRNGQYSLSLSTFLMLVIFAVRKFWKTIPKEYLPWVSIATGTAGGLATALAEGTAFGPTMSAVLTGALVGAGSIGLWELLGKKVLTK